MNPYVLLEGDGPNAHYAIGHSIDPSGNKKALLQLQDNDGNQVRVKLTFEDILNLTADLARARRQLNSKNKS